MVCLNGDLLAGFAFCGGFMSTRFRKLLGVVWLMAGGEKIDSPLTT